MYKSQKLKIEDFWILLLTYKCVYGEIALARIKTTKCDYMISKCLGDSYYWKQDKNKTGCIIDLLIEKEIERNWGKKWGDNAGCNAFFFIVMILFWLFCLVFCWRCCRWCVFSWLEFRSPFLSLCFVEGVSDVTTEPSRETNAIFHSIMMILFFLLLLHFLGIFFLFVAARCHTLPLSPHFPLAFLSRLSSEMSSRRKPANKQLKKKKIRIWFDRLVLLLPTAPAFSHPFLIYIKY